MIKRSWKGKVCTPSGTAVEKNALVEVWFYSIHVIKSATEIKDNKLEKKKLVVSKRNFPTNDYKK